MVFGVFWFCLINSVFSENFEHVDEFLKEKNATDIFNIARRFHQKISSETQQQGLADTGQQSLVLADSTACESGWVQFSGTGCCYRLTEAKGSWYDGTGFCKALHPCSQMASFHSEEECKFVATSYSGIHAWTGLSRTQIDNTWTYTDGTPAWNWFLSASSSEQAKKEESCVEMLSLILGLLYSLSAANGKMHNYDCTESISSICKYCPADAEQCTTTTTPETTSTVTTTITTPTTTMATTTTTRTTTSATTTIPQTTKSLTTVLSTTTTSPRSFSCSSICEYPSVQYKQYCVKMCEGYVTFANSCDWCNGTMITVSNKEENDFISKVYGKNNDEQAHIWLGNTASNAFLNWAPDQPSIPDDGLDYCIAMDLTAGKTRGMYRYFPCQSTVVNSLCLQS